MVNRVKSLSWVVSIGSAVLWVLAGLPVWAQSGAHIEFIDTGTPKNGDVVMTGWHGVIVRVVLDSSGSITRINLGGAGGFGGAISGALAQRWTDPTGQGNYTQTSPGPLTANNSFNSDFNFDSHFVGTPEMYAATSSFSEGYSGGRLTQRTGLMSDGFVGYVASPFIPQGADPIIYGDGIHMRAVLDLNPSFRSSSIDAAYVVTDSGFLLDAQVSSDTGGGYATGIFQLPEPGAITFSFVGTVLSLFKRRRRAGRVHASASVHELESRVHLSVAAPTGVSATLGNSGSAVIAWGNVGSGISYGVQRSVDGVSNWQTVTSNLLPPGTAQLTNPRLDPSLGFSHRRGRILKSASGLGGCTKAAQWDRS